MEHALLSQAGLTGVELVGQLLHNAAWSQVTTIGRRKVEVPAAYQVCVGVHAKHLLSHFSSNHCSKRALATPKEQRFEMDSLPGIRLSKAGAEGGQHGQPAPGGSISF